MFSLNDTACNTSPFIPSKGIIRSITELSADNHLFEVQVEDQAIIEHCKPGQFFQIYVPGSGEAPISISALSRKNCLEFCVRKVGRVTSALFQLKEGDWMGLRGPFGNGFPVDEMKGKNLILVAGGLGVAPLRSLWHYILDNRKEFKKIVLVYGMRHSEDLLFRQEFKQLIQRHDIELSIAAEDINGPESSIHFQLGRVTDSVKQSHFDETFVAALCGPPIMYDYVIQELKAKGLDDKNIWLSLERQMKCGVGKCGHCSIGGHFACIEGPVFSLAQLNFMREVSECKGSCKSACKGSGS